MSTEIKFSLKNLKKKIDALPKNNMTLKVGFLDAKTAQIAKQNEYGGVYPVSSEYKSRALSEGIHLGETIHIIPRPFMRTTINNHKSKWINGLGKLLQNNPFKQALSLLGEKMESDIKDTIINNDFEKNPAHIAKIKGRDRPLIDTGNMLNKVAHEIVE
jgi:hypothetical protein